MAPAIGKSDAETMRGQERERAFVLELCKEHEIEIAWIEAVIASQNINKP